MTGHSLLRLVDILNLLNEISTHTQYCFNRIEALALTCTRLASASDELGLSARYNRSQSAISEIFNEVITFLDERWGHLLHFDSDQLLSPANLIRYSKAIFDSGSPMQHVWGFIDCTVHPMCHPSHHQCQAYNVHKHFHGLKYQAVMLPNGLFGHLYGPIEGRHNNAFALEESRLMDECILHAKLPEGGGKSVNEADASGEFCHLQLFGDPAYGLNKLIVSPFPKTGQTDRNGTQRCQRLGSRSNMGLHLSQTIGSFSRQDGSCEFFNPQSGGTIVSPCYSQMLLLVFSPTKYPNSSVVPLHPSKSISMTS